MHARPCWCSGSARNHASLVLGDALTLHLGARSVHDTCVFAGLRFNSNAALRYAHPLFRSKVEVRKATATKAIESNGLKNIYPRQEGQIPE